MLEENTSTEGPIRIYCNEDFNPFEPHHKVQLEVTTEYIVTPLSFKVIIIIIIIIKYIVHVCLVKMVM